MTSRAEHLQWAKQRTLEFLEAGDCAGALASLTSDFLKHPELQRHPAPMLGATQMATGRLNTPAAMREFIEGVG